MAEVGYAAVEQEMLSGSHTFYPVIESIYMTSLLEHLAENGDASMSVS